MPKTANETIRLLKRTDMTDMEKCAVDILKRLTPHINVLHPAVGESPDEEIIVFRGIAKNDVLVNRSFNVAEALRVILEGRLLGRSEPAIQFTVRGENLECRRPSFGSHKYNKISEELKRFGINLSRGMVRAVS